MDNNVKVSVIVPVYNTEPWLKSCLNSLHCQNLQEIEFICVDDGSTDNSLAILKDFAAKDSRFVVISQTNGGPAKARNVALSHAKGEYVSFVDSDDFIVHGAYACLYDLAQKNNADIVVFGSYTEPDNAPEWLKEIISPRDVIYDNFKPEILFRERGARPFLWLHLVNRSIIADNGLCLDESMHLGEDQLFQMSYFPFAKKIVFTSEKYYHYRWQRDKSIMSSYNEDKLAKLHTHITIIDKAFQQALKYKDADKIQIELLAWSIFFIWGDITNTLTATQTEIATKLKNVWEKYNYKRFYNSLDCWGQKRLDQILLMAEGGNNYEAKIAAYNEAIKKLDEEINTIKASKAYKRAIRKNNNLIKKFLISLKENGIKKTWHKVKKYLPVR